MDKLEIKQIVLVTDGKSNMGGNPITAAKEAAVKNIVVNTIGIVSNHYQEESLYEIQQISLAGGGTWEVSTLDNLGFTMRAVTQKTINKTINTIVGNELKKIIGGDINEIPPGKRSKIVEYMEQLGEESSLKCCILMDCSGSMMNKLSSAKKSILELIDSLEGRKGHSQLAIIAFPGEKGEMTRLVQPLTENFKEAKTSIMSLRAGGTTPTAAAINKAVCIMEGMVIDNMDEIIANSEPMLRRSMV
jgi:Ca-activated chloride channel family protein